MKKARVRYDSLSTAAQQSFRRRKKSSCMEDKPCCQCFPGDDVHKGTSKSRLKNTKIIQQICECDDNPLKKNDALFAYCACSVELCGDKN